MVQKHSDQAIKKTSPRLRRLRSMDCESAVALSQSIDRSDFCAHEHMLDIDRIQEIVFIGIYLQINTRQPI
jgi:hypothetical protein